MEKVSILLSIYKPDRQYLKEQLISLNDQTYENLELLVWNDCPEEKTEQSLFETYITRFPVYYFGEGTNLGYVRAFERLSALATGEYISYCDQDDIWEPQKIEKCVQAIRETGAVAVVCDKSLMCSDGTVYAKSYRENSRFACDRWHTGDDITARAAFMGYCTGMTLIAKRKTVQRFLPFVPDVAHDQQLVLFLSACGKMAYVEEPLIRYRRHGGNETGLLYGVESKADYYRTRCIPSLHLMDRFRTLFPNYPRLQEMICCSEARAKGSIRGIWRYREMIPDTYKYEIALALCPDFVFRRIKKHFVKSKYVGIK